MKLLSLSETGKQLGSSKEWVLIEAAMKIVGHDVALANFYTRIRKRSSAKIARVAVARKLAEICWKRLRRWQAEHQPAVKELAR
jgi:hypothetical protein